MPESTLVANDMGETNLNSEAAPDAVARLHAVTKLYEANRALDNFSFSIHPGEIVALLGPNGAGKTTAIRLLLGLIAPTSGSVRVLGRNPRDSSTRTQIGAMLQVAKVPENMRVREHIDLFRSYYPRPLSTPDVIRAASLHGIENKFFGKLSGGQKQRVLFGLALCGDPDLVFLDEPTVGMDIEARRALWEQVRMLSARGKSILFTTHYLEEADALASRILLMGKGKMISQGTPAQIKSQVSERRIRCATSLDAGFVRGLPSVKDVQEDRGLLVITASQPEVVVREMLRLDASLHNLEISSAALEDAFLALTKN